jgi:hypothetical protein
MIIFIFGFFDAVVVFGERILCFLSTKKAALNIAATIFSARFFYHLSSNHFMHRLVIQVMAITVAFI